MDILAFGFVVFWLVILLGGISFAGLMVLLAIDTKERIEERRARRKRGR